jgi:hypothetical protein
MVTWTVGPSLAGLLGPQPTSASPLSTSVSAIASVKNARAAG